MVKMYSFDDLFLFAQVVEIGSYLHTAKKLKISETTIARRIKNLEDSLNIKLFHLTTKHFEVTSLGAQIFDAIKDPSNNLDRLVESIDRIIVTRLEPHGTVILALPPVIALELITPNIPDFLENNPKINLNIIYQNKTIDLVRDGVDVAIVNHVPKQQSQTIKNVFTDGAKLYCTSEYARKFGVPNTLQELGDHLVTGYLNDDYSVEDDVHIFNIKTGKSEVIPMPRRLVTNSGFHNIRLLYTNKVICGLLSNHSDLEFQTGGDIIHVLPDYMFAKTNFYLLRHPLAKNELKIKAICDFLEKCLRKPK